MGEPTSPEQQLQGFQKDFGAICAELSKVVVGHDATIRLAAVAAVAGGHVLLEGVPGIGKTTLVETLGTVLDLECRRIQFTPDLMPTDLLGTHVIMENQQGRRTFEFQQGPIFCNLVLAEQINRGVPKTQSALLEAMEGDQVSVSTETFELPKPFLVMATQNPMEMEGTFPLPEPQLDRFFFKLSPGPPSTDQIEEILTRTTEGEAPVAHRAVGAHRLLEMREVARGVAVDASLRRHAAEMVAATHPDHPQATDRVRRYVRYGSSPRGAQVLITAAKILAAASGRSAVSADGLREVTAAALAHRLILNYEAQAEGVSAGTILDSIGSSAPPD